MMAPATAHQNPFTWKPLRMDPANQNTSALSTSRNRPSVTTVMGSVRKMSTGLTRVLSSPRTSAAMSAEPKDATVMPGRTYATTSSATAFSIQMRMSSMVGLRLVTVVVGLEGAVDRHADVVGLLLRKRREVGVELLQ